MPTQLSILSKPRGDVHIQNLLVADKIENTKPQSSEERLRALFSKVVPNAILNAGGRADDVQCHPGTRERVIEMVETWMGGKADSPDTGSKIMWLSGPAGAGKSAIMQTVAERQKARGHLAPNFFFFREDDTRNHADGLVATLLYQLMESYPALKEVVESVLSATPLILKQSIADQFSKLITSAIDTIARHDAFPITLLVDGLDECKANDQFKKQQQQVLQVLHDLVTRANSPFNVLIASRREPHLIRNFKKLEKSTQFIFLEDDSDANDGIRRFVTDKFLELKATHHLARHLGEQWPSETAINDIVAKSSAQFIYAATVMRFLETSSASPKVMLEIVQGVKPAEDHSPFAQIDAVYSYIFSQVKNKPAVKAILGIHFIMNIPGPRLSVTFTMCLLLYNNLYNLEMLESLISDLTSILRLDTKARNAGLVFYHASLGDYLRDQSRSGVHHVDLEVTCVNLCVAILKCRNSLAYFDHAWKVMHIVAQLYSTAGGYRQYLIHLTQRTMTLIIEMYFTNHRDKYENMLRRWICLCYRHNRSAGLENLVYPLFKKYICRVALEMRWYRIQCRLQRHKSFSPVWRRGPCDDCLIRKFNLNEPME